MLEFATFWILSLEKMDTNILSSTDSDKYSTYFETEVFYILYTKFIYF